MHPYVNSSEPNWPDSHEIAVNSEIRLPVDSVRNALNRLVEVVNVKAKFSMRRSGLKERPKGAMPVFAVRLPVETALALLAESESSGRPVSETLRQVAKRHAAKVEESLPEMEKLTQIHRSITELGKDLETVTRMLLVALKISSDEEARAWTAKNLRVGR